MKRCKHRLTYNLGSGNYWCADCGRSMTVMSTGTMFRYVGGRMVFTPIKQRKGGKTT